MKVEMRNVLSLRISIFLNKFKNKLNDFWRCVTGAIQHIQTLVSNVFLFSRSEVKIICRTLKTKVKSEINLQDF